MALWLTHISIHKKLICYLPCIGQDKTDYVTRDVQYSELNGKWTQPSFSVRRWERTEKRIAATSATYPSEHWPNVSKFRRTSNRHFLLLFFPRNSASRFFKGLNGKTNLALTVKRWPVRFYIVTVSKGRYIQTLGMIKAARSVYINFMLSCS
jgi:hypothetical protein